jgi:Domain of unknown function (DUF4091)
LRKHRIHSDCFTLIIGITVYSGGSCGSAPPSLGSRGDVRLEVIRDTFVSNVGQEADGNNGRDGRLKIKSIQEMTLLDVDAKPLVGKTIRGATLHLKLAGNETLKRVTISSVGAEWFEGKGSGYAIVEGGATFNRRRHPDLPWSMGGGDVCHVILGNGGTTWRMADASPPDREGWQHVPVDPVVVSARVAGLSYGFLVFDDTGSEWTRRGESFTRQIFPNRSVCSRDQNRSSAPYFTVELGPEDRLPPEAPSELRTEPQTLTLPAGEAIVSWVTPRDAGPAGTLGFIVSLDNRSIKRELIPLAGAPGERVQMHLRYATAYAGKTPALSVRAVDRAGNLGPPATGSIQVSDRRPIALPQPVSLPGIQAAAAKASPLPWLGSGEIAIIDELDKVNPITGALIPAEPEGYLAANHLWDAQKNQISLHAARNEFVAFQILWHSQGPLGIPQPQLIFDGPAGEAVKVEFGRYQCVAARGGPLPDPIVPLNYPLPPAGSRVKSQSLHVEIYIPHDLPAVVHTGELTLTARGRAGPESLRLPVSLRVWDFTLPDHLSFLPEMNCYGLPTNERDYYRLAHRHRTVLNRVPYLQNGRVEDGCAPEWDAARNDFDWSAWDRRFGPLLDGSAFSDLPRKGVPVDSFYLPLHENWPKPMEGNYNGDYWADRAFPDSYRSAFVATSRAFATHIQSRRWTETLFQCFMNNKINFKERGWSRATSPWLLDEPANFQDYWALRYFARAFHEGINQAWGAGELARPNSAMFASSSSAAPRLVFRADISRPQWQKDSLDGLLDYLAVNSAMRTYPELVFERKRALDEIVVEYGATNAVEGSNVQPVGWCIDAWTLGADGIHSWQTIGTADSWQRADETSLFYPGRGRASGRGRTTSSAAGSAPIPSIRLKAHRRGQQDVEYLELWSNLHKEPRWAVGAQVRATLKLAGTRQGTGFAGGEDAGRIDFDQLRPGNLWALRVALGEALSRAHPAPKQKLVDLRTPRREVSHQPQVYTRE